MSSLSYPEDDDEFIICDYDEPVVPVQVPPPPPPPAPNVVTVAGPALGDLTTWELCANLSDPLPSSRVKAGLGLETAIANSLESVFANIMRIANTIPKEQQNHGKVFITNPILTIPMKCLQAYAAFREFNVATLTTLFASACTNFNEDGIGSFVDFNSFVATPQPDGNHTVFYDSGLPYVLVSRKKMLYYYLASGSHWPGGNSVQVDELSGRIQAACRGRTCLPKLLPGPGYNWDIRKQFKHFYEHDASPTCAFGITLYAFAVVANLHFPTDIHCLADAFVLGMRYYFLHGKLTYATFATTVVDLVDSVDEEEDEEGEEEDEEDEEELITPDMRLIHTLGKRPREYEYMRMPAGKRVCTHVK